MATELNRTGVTETMEEREAYNESPYNIYGILWLSNGNFNTICNYGPFLNVTISIYRFITVLQSIKFYSSTQILAKKQKIKQQWKIQYHWYYGRTKRAKIHCCVNKNTTVRKRLQRLRLMKFSTKEKRRWENINNFRNNNIKYW